MYKHAFTDTTHFVHPDTGCGRRIRLLKSLPAICTEDDLPWSKQGLLEKSDPTIFEKKQLKSTMTKEGAASVT